jgi:hypothetical protein
MAPHASKSLFTSSPAVLTEQLPDQRSLGKAPILAFLAFVAALTFVGVLLATNLIMQGIAPASPAQLAELVEVPGGSLRVDHVIPEQMAAMHAGKFAQSGMNMSGMGIDMTPEGYRRFTVEITLAGEARGGLRYPADQFRVTGTGMEATGPLRHQLGNGIVPEASAASGTLIFQVPEAATDLLLSFGDEGRPIALNLEAADDHPHQHGQDDHQHEEQPHDH